MVAYALAAQISTKLNALLNGSFLPGVGDWKAKADRDLWHSISMAKHRLPLGRGRERIFLNIRNDSPPTHPLGARIDRIFYANEYAQRIICAQGLKFRPLNRMPKIRRLGQNPAHDAHAWY